MRIEELPRIDVVLISHNHYDHLDEQSVIALNAQKGGPPLFIVPLGIERWLHGVGITHTRALDWWDTVQVQELTVHLVPVQHWSRRTLADTNTTLWGGFVIEGESRGKKRRVFFSGDTGYSKQHFSEIGSRFGGVDLALIPIGAYEPRWFMSAQHVNPEEAVQVHRDLRARLSVGIHWGTFQLTDEPIDQAVTDLAAARSQARRQPRASSSRCGTARRCGSIHSPGSDRCIRRSALACFVRSAGVPTMATSAPLLSASECATRGNRRAASHQA